MNPNIPADHGETSAQTASKMAVPSCPSSSGATPITNNDANNVAEGRGAVSQNGSNQASFVAGGKALVAPTSVAPPAKPTKAPEPPKKRMLDSSAKKPASSGVKIPLPIAPATTTTSNPTAARSVIPIAPSTLMPGLSSNSAQALAQFRHLNPGVAAAVGKNALGSINSATGGHLPLPLPSLAGAPAGGIDANKLTPSVFRENKLRSGKWIREEESYSELLIDLFEKGYITDCENGSTLRSYLSQKLHCAPMRISKKYAGKGIGKMVYLAKTGSEAPSVQERERIDKLLKASEHSFIRAATHTADHLYGAFDRFANAAALSGMPMVPGMFPLAVPHTSRGTGATAMPFVASMPPPFFAPPSAAAVAALARQAQLAHPQRQVATAAPHQPSVNATVAALMAKASSRANKPVPQPTPSASPAPVTSAPSAQQQQPQPPPKAAAASTFQHGPEQTTTSSMLSLPKKNTTTLTTTTAPKPTHVAEKTNTAQLAIPPKQVLSSTDPRTISSAAADQSQLRQSFLSAVAQGEASSTKPQQVQVKPPVGAPASPAIAKPTALQRPPSLPALASFLSAHKSSNVATRGPTSAPATSRVPPVIPETVNGARPATALAGGPGAANVNPQISGNTGGSAASGASRSVAMAAPVSHPIGNNVNDCEGVDDDFHLPDYLAGFDKVALSMKRPEGTSFYANGGGGPAASNLSDLQYSPPFTSRSFDDFHRLLGKDLALLEEASKNGNSASEDTSGPSIRIPDTEALFTAESYAAFAQESAIAASQHDAYLAEASGVPSPPASLDIAGTVRLVSEHVQTSSSLNAVHHHHNSSSCSDAASPTQHHAAITKVPVKTTTATHGPQSGNMGVNQTHAQSAPLPNAGSGYSVNQQQPQQQQENHLIHKDLFPPGVRVRIEPSALQTRLLNQTAIISRARQEYSRRSSAPLVSGSEPASSTETESSLRGSTSESNGSDQNNEDSEDGNHTSNTEDGGAGSEDDSEHRSESGQRGGVGPVRSHDNDGSPSSSSSTSSGYHLSDEGPPSKKARRASGTETAPSTCSVKAMMREFARD